MSSEFATGFVTPECPRWHDGSLWVTDMAAHEVLRIDMDGTRHLVHRFPDDEEPGGIGWLPDGTMLVVGMQHRVVYRLARGKASMHADLRELAPFHANDMITDATGTAYVSHFGFDLFGGGERKPTVLIRVAPDGTVDAAAEDMESPNGMAISEDGQTLVVAEPGGARLSRFTIRDGELRTRMIIPLEKAPTAQRVTPDGICLDVEGGVWAADPHGRRVIHVDADGATDRVVPFHVGYPLACVLGSPERRTLFVCIADDFSLEARTGEPRGRIVTIEVDVPGQGRP